MAVEVRHGTLNKEDEKEKQEDKEEKIGI